MAVYCINTKSYDGTRTIFTEEQREKKCLKHPELRSDEFVKRARATIENPSFVYEDMAENRRLVYYKYEYSANGRARYVKVVIVAKNNHYFVIIAYRPDYVKEKGKARLIYGKDVY